MFLEVRAPSLNANQLLINKINNYTLTFCAMAENFSTLSVSSYAEAHWLMFTIMYTFPLPLKNP